MGEVIDLQFTIDGNKVLEPVNWQDLKEMFEYGQNSNQPSIDAESFTFQGDAANLIFNHISPNGILGYGNILTPLDLNITYTQNGLTTNVIEDYIIDFTKGFQLNDTSFNNQIAPKEVICNIRKKIGSDYFLTEVQGLTWGLLIDEGAVTSSDYNTIKTAVVPIYSFLDIVTTLITIYSLAKQFADTVEKTAETIADAIDRTGEGALTGFGAGTVLATAYIILKATLQAISAILLLALLVKTVLDLIVMLIPPVLNNKGITLKRGMEIICERLGYTFETNLPILEQVCYMPSGAFSDGNNIVKNNLPSWFANERGVPNEYDYGYVCVDFVEICKKIVNGRIDVFKSALGVPTVRLINENDPILFQTGDYMHNIEPNYSNIEYNLPDIPHTRLISFQIDDTEGYTTEYQEGRMWEVKNISNDGNLPFTNGEYIDMNMSLGYRKKDLVIGEKIVVEMAGIADGLARLLGQNTKLKETIRGGRIGILAVTQNNFGKPKLVVNSNGKIPSNYLDIFSAKIIENDYYVNRSIVRGNGQKILIRGLEIPMSLEDREKIKDNGNFQDSVFGQCTFKSVEYQYSKDTAICDITVDSNYIAPNSFTEKSYDGLEES